MVVPGGGAFSYGRGTPVGTWGAAVSYERGTSVGTWGAAVSYERGTPVECLSARSGFSRLETCRQRGATFPGKVEKKNPQPPPRTTFGSYEASYRGTSLIRTRTRLGPHSRTMPRVLGGS